MTTITNWFHQESRYVSIEETKDPVPVLLDKLSSNEQIKIKIHNMLDNIIIQNGKKFQSIHIPQLENGTNSQIPRFDKLISVLSNKRSPSFPTTEQKYLLSKLKFIPIYTVVNNNNEIVTASPREFKDSYSLKWIQEKLYELFFWTHDEGSVAINLFFMNKEDASTYMHEICKKEPREAENLGLKVKEVGLDIFYKLNRTSPPKTQNRLVADLKEIDTLLTNHLSTPSSIVHPKQKYSKYWFQGSPIYTITFQKNLMHKTLSEYFFQPGIDKKVIFFNKEDAVRAWRTFLAKDSTFKLHKNPTIEIYNLESLLFDMENNKERTIELVFVPPYNTYLSMKNEKTELLVSNNNRIEEYLYNAKLSLKNLQRFYKGVVWLFTSDTLPSEENSW